jgi:elongation factor Ts
MITADQVKELREETGISVAKCKEALEQAQGDMDAARAVLREWSAAAAEKKADRELGAGIVAAYVHNNKTVGTLLQLLCETDFVAKNDDFVSLANNLAMHITAMGSTPETIKDEPFILDPEQTVAQMITGATQKLGERVELGTFSRYTIGE